MISACVSEKANTLSIILGSPEALERKGYTEKGDVYSFGLVSWQLETGETEPYREIKEHFDLAVKIVSGHRPEIPENCDSKFAELIRRCWDNDPQARPNMDEVVTKLREYQNYRPT